MIPVSQPSGLGELAASTVTEADKRLEAVQKAQIRSLVGVDKTKEPQEKTPKRQSPTLATRPKKYALELWVEIETRAGVYTTPEEDSYSVDFAIDTLNHTYPGCTGMYVVPPQSWGDRSDTKHSKCLLLGGRRLNQLTLIPKPKGSGGARAATAQVGPANKRDDTKRCLPVEASLRPGEAIPW